MANKYYSGQGRFYVAERTVAGKPTGFVELGNVPSMEISIETTKFEHKESMSGQRAVDLSIVQEKKGTFTMTLESLDPVNLALALWGQSSVVASGSVLVGAPEAVVAYLGKRVPLAHPGVAAVVVKDSTDTTTYVVGDDYAVDLVNGVITPLTGGDIDELDVLHVSYTFVAGTKVDAFTETSMERWLRFEGLNTIDGKAVIIDMFKASLDPLSGYALINEELGSVEITGSILYDDLQTGDSKFFSQTNVT